MLEGRELNPLDLSAELFDWCGDCEYIIDRCIRKVASAFQYGDDLKLASPTGATPGQPADFQEWLDKSRSVYFEEWDDVFDVMAEGTYLEKCVLASAHLFDGESEKGVNRFSLQLATELGGMQMALEIAALKSLRLVDDPPLVHLRRFNEIRARLPYLVHCTYRIRERAWQLRVFAKGVGSDFATTGSADVHAPEDVEKVRSALMDLTWEAKAEAIVARCRPMRRQKALSIRRMLLRERSGNPGTSERSGNEGTSETSR